MNNETFKHYLKEIISSAQSGDFVKLLGQLDYFSELSLSQQLETGSVAKESIDTKTFFKIYEEIVRKDPHQIRANHVLRKMMKDVFIQNQEPFASLLKTIDISSDKTTSYLGECVTECANPEITSIWNQRINGVVTESSQSTTPQISNISNSRESIMAQIKELGGQKSAEAIQDLSILAGTDVGFDVIIINQLMSSGLEEGIEATIQFLASQSTRVRHYAVAKPEELRVKATPALLSQLKLTFAQDASDHSIAILGIIKTVATIEDARELRRLMNNVPEDVNVRVAYYETLAELNPTAIAPFLIEQVCDGVDDVAYSAAVLLDKQCSPAIVEGVQNVIISELITIERLVEVLVFASCSNLINNLIEEQMIADEVQRLCQLPGMESYAKKYNVEGSSSTILRTPTIWAIDDSRMILRMYDHFAVKTSSELQTFEQGSELLDSLKTEQPALFFIDLNMPGMTGVEVAQAIDEKGFKHIPKILVTTQSDAALDSSAENLFSEIVQKPFNAGTLEIVANRYITKG